MAVPSRAGALEELATRPGRDTIWSTLARRCLIGTSAVFLAALLLAPLAVVFVSAFEKGVSNYFQTFADPDTQAAIRLTLLTALVVVPLNTVFGLAAAWALAKFEFRGKSLALTLIDLPIAVSPVISGLLFVLLFGVNGWFGAWLQAHGITVIFAVPGIMIATLFVTFPYVARELIPLMQQLGNDEEEAAITLGAGAWMTFLRVTLPKIRWGLLYGVILCNARAMGEFGAVSVVSGQIRGLTNTMPLTIEALYNDYDFTGAFAVASLLTLLALATLALKALVERIGYRRQ
jgi:sulfate/thiosulfate transport system permease protein